MDADGIKDCGTGADGILLRLALAPDAATTAADQCDASPLAIFSPQLSDSELTVRWLRFVASRLVRRTGLRVTRNREHRRAGSSNAMATATSISGDRPFVAADSSKVIDAEPAIIAVCLTSNS